MSDNIQTTATRQTPSCLQQKIEISIQSIEDKLKRVILHDLENGKQGKPRKSDEKVLDKQQQA